MYESNDAASIKTVTGWVSRDGHFWGNDEHMARWGGCTHRICENNPDHGVHEIRSYCEKCHDERRQQYFDSLEKKVFAGENLVIFDSDFYFFDFDSLIDYCIENEVLPSELRLMICEPNHIPEFYIIDHCENELPEDGDESHIPRSVLETADALNKAIRESDAISWSQGKYAAIVSDDILTDEQKAEIFASRADNADKVGE